MKTYSLSIRKTLALAMTLAVLGYTMAHAEDGVTDTSIKLGMSNALSGPAKGLGTEMKEGTRLYIDKANTAGGVHGRKIEIVSLDDQYEPEQAAKNTQKLIDDEKVFALTGYVGTPTGKAATPILSQKGVPLIGMFTGAEAFRNPVNKQLFHIRASYFDETESIVSHLVKDLKIKDIGVFIQEDAYGDAGKSGVQRALAKLNLELAAEGKYKRNTTEIDGGLDALMKAKPKAVVLVGAYAACAAFMRKSIEKGWRPIFINISFVGTKGLIDAAGSAAEGSYITQVAPLLRDYPFVKKYKADMKNAGLGAGTYGSLEGYMNAIVLVEALKKAGKALTRDALRNALEGMKGFDIGGLRLDYSPTDHEGFRDVFLTKVIGGKVTSVDKME